MGAKYHQLREFRQEPTDSLPARAWLAMRRAVAQLVGAYMGRKKWSVKCAKRVTWAGLWAGIQQAMRRRTRVTPARYDSAAYAMNFDDGRWKEEEEEFWRSGSFACRFGNSGRRIPVV